MTGSDLTYFAEVRDRIDDLVMTAEAFVAATSDFFQAVYIAGYEPTVDDLEYYQERVANLDLWIADGRGILAEITNAEREFAGWRGRNWELIEAEPQTAVWFDDGAALLAETRQTISDYLEDLRLLYGAAVSAADQIAASLERQAAADGHRAAIVALIGWRRR